MEKLIRARDICERYGCAKDTAYRYMRQMPHMENPLRVTVEAFEAWERARTREPGAWAETPSPKKAPAKRARVPKNDGKHLIPRTRG